MAAVKGAEKLMRQLNNLGNISPVLEKAMRKETLRVQRNAVLLCPVNHGELRQTIKTKVEATEGMVVGTVYTNNKHAAYVEFGTGPVGEANHEGISPEVNPVYSSKDGWWFPERGKDGKRNVTSEDAAKYHWPSMTAEDGNKLYFTHGQPAQPFMYPALKGMEDIVCMNLNAALVAGIEKV